MKALLLIDIQSDFVPGGALAVPEGDRVVPVANALMARNDLVIATQDWHPAGHASFAAAHPGRRIGEVIDLDGLSQVLWPVHCVQGTPGAEFHRDLDVKTIDRVFTKGTDPRIDSYSGFFDNGHRKATGLGDWLRGKGVDHLTIMGLATDYCVKFSVLDALDLGFKVDVVRDGCRAVNLAPGDGDKAFEEMKARGATIVENAPLQ